MTHCWSSRVKQVAMVISSCFCLAKDTCSHPDATVLADVTHAAPCRRTENGASGRVSSMQTHDGLFQRL